MEKKLIFQTCNLEKQYAGTKVLKDVSITIEAGKVVGLVGENGAGKSTLLKLIMGVERPTAGTMQAHGKDYAPHSPRDANRQGVGMVFQEQSLTLNLTVGQNINLGNEEPYKRFGIVDWKRMYKDVNTYLDEMGITTVRAEKKVQDYMFSDRQMVEIARVLKTVQDSGSEKCLILLDEPTSVLNDEEIKQLFGYIRRLKDNGNSVIFVSHRLDEILEISDMVYVLKDGELVGSLSKDEANEQILYQMMVGTNTNGEYYRIAEQQSPGSEVLLEFEGVGLKGACKDVSFKLHRGEILGICGVTGSGKEDVCAIACGDIAHTSGIFKVHGKTVHWKEPHQALTNRILSVPKERRLEAICEKLSIRDNMVLSNYDVARKGPAIYRSKQRSVAQEMIRKVNVKCNSEEDRVGSLSGGNAQKVVFARAMLSDAEVLILNHPTRGVDVGAKAEIYAFIREMTRQGKAVLLLGDTLEECIGLSNRLLVMKDGIVTKEYDAAPDNKPTQFDIIQYMM